MKTCTVCGEMKEIEAFYVNNNGRSPQNRRSECKECGNAKTREYNKRAYPRKKTASCVADTSVQDELEYMAFLARQGNGFVIDDSGTMEWCYGNERQEEEKNWRNFVKRK